MIQRMKLMFIPDFMKPLRMTMFGAFPTMVKHPPVSEPHMVATCSGRVWASGAIW